MSKEYIITKSQFKKLIDEQKNRKTIVDSIMNEINEIESKIQVDSIKEEAIKLALRERYELGELNHKIIKELYNRGLKKDYIPNFKKDII